MYLCVCLCICIYKVHSVCIGYRCVSVPYLQRIIISSIKSEPAEDKNLYSVSRVPPEMNIFKHFVIKLYIYIMK